MCAARQGFSATDPDSGRIDLLRERERDPWRTVDTDPDSGRIDLLRERERGPWRTVDTDPDSGRIDLLRERERGPWRTVDTDVDYDARGLLRFSVHPDDPGSAKQDIALTTTMGPPGWRVRTEVHTRIACTAMRLLCKHARWRSKAMTRCSAGAGTRPSRATACERAISGHACRTGQLPAVSRVCLIGISSADSPLAAPAR